MSPAQLLLTACATVAIAAAGPLPAAAQTALTVAFEGIKDQKGAIMVAVYDSEAAYDGGKPASATAIPATAARVETKIAGLAPGRYAIKAFHDLNGDGKMGTNPFGMPIEPFAFSNNAVGTMGPAKWSAAAFTVEGDATVHAMTID
ncbi:DUF2141 domain-containing protein [Phenylobacterium sp.]|uniref:DUF2141 domain-containing protein n=1 Tax=Phenylobacterium sp. TaxID=1871053 RepID=UPI00286D5B65|nr:DUF2141 domain-containing protein [Phenylobacterium sp.]